VDVRPVGPTHLRQLVLQHLQRVLLQGWVQ
jgi:hypothetical protein